MEDESELEQPRLQGEVDTPVDGTQLHVHRRPQFRGTFKMEE